MLILIFTAALNRFMTDGETVWLSFWVLKITQEGTIRAVMMMLRILMLVAGTFLLTYTTSPIALTDGLESLLSPLKKIRLPVHELAMMMCIALRFIPTLIEETDKIMSAQKARGADFESGNLLQRVKALVPILIPLFISAFRRADELATAMECRCYHGGDGRTKMKLLRYTRWVCEEIHAKYCVIFNLSGHRLQRLANSEEFTDCARDHGESDCYGRWTLGPCDWLRSD